MAETDGLYYFNRCRRCTGLITKLEVKRALETGGDICACGSGMFGPSNPIGSEWISPKVLRMIVAKLLGRLAPAPEPGVMPHVPELTGFLGRPPQGVAPLSEQEQELLRGGE